MSETLYKVEIGRRLRAAIEALGTTQAAICKAFHVSPSKLGNWIRGDNYPSPWFVKQLCDRYGVTTEWIYRGIVTGMAKGLADDLWQSERTKGIPPPHPPKGGSVRENQDEDCDKVVQMTRETA